MLPKRNTNLPIRILNTSNQALKYKIRLNLNLLWSSKISVVKRESLKVSNRTYHSGAPKRKKASKAKENLPKILTLTSFLLVQKSKPVVSDDLFLRPSTSLIST